ncbi:hydrogenase 4 subunit B [Phenylobacterium sp. LjRoot219]|uniref:hydrogenase 4 subunit B n=1 Tax=Phenylobacterium sp. LjRoot219 TaxID=3342283 RepID=UPI003ECDE533
MNLSVLTAEIWSIVALLVIGGGAAVGVRTRAPSLVVYPLCALVTAAMGALALWSLLQGHDESLVLPLGVPWVGSHLRLDSLAGLFLAIVGFGGCAASVYAIGYGRHERSPERVLPFFPAFLAGMSLVVLAGDAFTFLVSWEFMSVMSWALVMAHHKEPGATHAGYVYLVMASFGTLALLLAFGLLAGPQGHYDFATIRTVVGPRPLAGLVLILALVGTGSKAGLVPLHVWLPLAHPAAPSHVSGLMSGIMTKVAIYGFIRIAFDLLGPPQWWWSVALLATGAVTAVVGLLYALLQDDLKRLLAYSTVENIGIIFLGLGLALAFKANGLTEAAALAMTASLLHAINHATFKTLLFFGAGSVLSATGERNLGALGGLIHRLPLTAALFLVGSAAISALPPLNGFVSEWLLFQAVLISPTLPQWGLKFLVPAAGAMLALAAALAAACFVRAYGVAFLGRPRSPAAAEAREVDAFQTGTMIILGLICVLVGVLPGFVIDALGPIVGRLAGGGGLPPQAAQAWLRLVPLSASRSSYDGMLVFIFIAFAAATSAVLVRTIAAKAVRRAPAWDCGYPDARPVTQYSPSSFSQPLRRVFGGLLFQARETVEMPAPGDTAPARFSLRVRDLVWELLYAPLAGAVDWTAERLNRLQFLTIRQYLSLVFAALVLLLTTLTLWR